MGAAKGVGAAKGAGAIDATSLPAALDLTVTSSSARKAASSAAVGSEPSFNPEAGAMSPASLF